MSSTTNNTKQKIIYLLDDDFLLCENNIEKLVKKYLINDHKNNSIVFKQYNNENFSCLCEFKFEWNSFVVEVFFKKLNLDKVDIEKFSNYLVDNAYDFIDISFSKIIEYSNECMDKMRRNEIVSLIQRKLSFFEYLEHKSIFHFINDIFVDILTEHKLCNGNKIMAFAIMLRLLESCGFYFKYSKPSDSKVLISKYKENINYIKQLLSDYGNDNSASRLDALKSQTYKFIEENVIVSYKFFN